MASRYTIDPSSTSGPSTEEVALGPIIDEKQLKSVDSKVQESVIAGATIRAGATHDGLFYRPTVLTDLTPEMPAWNQEIFGPVAPIFTFTEDDDAVRAADVVITMGCGDVCPILPGKRYEDWLVGDPALASPAGVAAIRDELDTRVRALLTDLLPDLDLPTP